MEMDKTIILQLSKIPGPKAGPDDYQVSVLYSPFGNTRPTSVELSDGEKVLRSKGRPITLRGIKRRLKQGDPPPAMLDDLGEFLYRKVCQPDVLRTLCMLVARFPLNRNRLRLCLNVTADAEYLETIPWEYLKSDKSGLDIGWFAHKWISITRTFDRPLPQKLTVSKPLKILLAYANPYRSSEVEARTKDFLERTCKMLDAKGGVTVKRLWKATRADFEKELGAGHDLVHFIGHGYVRDDDERAYLRLEDDEMHADNILEALPPRPPLLIYLNSCSTALADEYGSFTSLAQDLIKSDSNPVPAVVAMQYDIFVADSLTFADKFYTSLFEGWPHGPANIEQAVSDARRVMGDRNYIWGVPLLFLQMRETLPPLGGDGGGGDGPRPKTVPPPPELYLDFFVPPLPPFGARPEATRIAETLNEGEENRLVVYGPAGVGRTTVTRAAVEPLLQNNAVVTWHDFEAFDDASCHAATLYLALGRAFGADLRPVWYDAGRESGEKMDELEKVISEYSILMLENFDSFFDAEGRFRDPALETLFQRLSASKKDINVILTTRARPATCADERGWRGFHVEALSRDEAVTMLREEEVNLPDNYLVRIGAALGNNPRALKLFAAAHRRAPDDDYLLDRLENFVEADYTQTHEFVWALLDERQRGLAKALAVFRRPVPAAYLARLTEDASAAATGSLFDPLLDGEPEEGLIRLTPLVREAALAELSRDVEQHDREHLRAAEFYLGQWDTDALMPTAGELAAGLERHYHLRAAGARRDAYQTAEGLFEPLARRGMYRELETLLAQTSEHGPETAYARVFRARFLYLTGDYDTALKLLHESLREVESVSYEHAAFLAEIGTALRRRERPEDTEEMKARFETAYESFNLIRDGSENQHLRRICEFAMADIMYHLGTFDQYLGRGRTAEQLEEAYMNALNLFRWILTPHFGWTETIDETLLTQSDDKKRLFAQARASKHLGEIYGDEQFDEHDAEEAERMLALAEALADAAGDAELSAQVIYERARFARSAGEDENARALFRRAAELASEAGALALEAMAEVQIAALDFEADVYSFERLDRVLAWCEEKLSYFTGANVRRIHADALYLHGLLMLEEQEGGRRYLLRAQKLFAKCRQAVEQTAEEFRSQTDEKLLKNATGALSKVYDLLHPTAYARQELPERPAREVVTPRRESVATESRTATSRETGEIQLMAHLELESLFSADEAAEARPLATSLDGDAVEAES